MMISICLFIVPLLFISSAECYIVSSPQNTAVFPGTRVSFVCASNTSTSGLDWNVQPHDQSSSVAVIRSCELNPSYDGIYDVEAISAGACNIVVVSAKFSEAGSYICQEATGFDPPQSAQLVLIESDPDCVFSFPTGNTSDVAEGETVRLSCTVRYTANLSPFTTQWTDPNGQSVTPQEWTTEDGQFYSVIEFPATPPFIYSYSALTYFPDPVSPPTTATNPPSYNYQWTSPHIPVLYCPTNLTVMKEDGFPEEFSAGDNLTCYSSSSPNASYYWTDKETGHTNYSQWIIIPEPGFFWYICTAYNYIREEFCNSSLEINGTAGDAKILPLNTAVVAGRNSTLYCMFGRNPLSWIMTLPGLSGVTIAPECVVLSSITEYFAVESLPGACHLSHLNANKSQAGIYTCQEMDTPSKPPTAQLIVLDSNPICTDDLTDGIAVSGERIRINCRVNYTGAFIPTMTWTLTDEVIGNASNLTTPTEARFQIDMPIYPPNVPSFACRTFFTEPIIPNSPVSVPAKNAPDYEYIWSSATRVVHYCPTFVSVNQPSGDYIFVGDVLTCSADGYPDPKFTWTNLATGISTDGPTLQVTAEGSYNFECTAYTTIRDTNCSLSTATNFVAYELKTPDNVATEAGRNATLSCRHVSSDVLWLFSSVADTSSVSIVSGCRVLASYVDKYAVDNTNDRCDLIVIAADASQAGTYTCQDPMSLDVPPSALLIVLDSAPDCLVNLTGGCDSILSCSVNYTGHMVPRMAWFDRYGQPVEDVIYEYQFREVRSYFNVSGEDSSSTLESYTCKTFFDEPQSVSVPTTDHTKPATNAPSYTDIWESPTILYNYTISECPILMQQNLDRSNHYFFNRNWEEFRQEFGTYMSNYWFGLERLYQLTYYGACSLHVDIQERDTNRWYSAEYSYFYVESGANNYVMRIGSYSGNAGNALQYHANRPFSTYDFGSSSSCAQSYKGGFWYGNCGNAYINSSPDYYFRWIDSDGSPYFYLETTRLWLTCNN